MKRIFALLVLLALVCGVFAGCGGEPVEPEVSEAAAPVVSQTLSAVIYDRGGDSEYWNAVIAAFEAENPGVTVDAHIGDDAAYILRDAILAGAAPDFAVLPSDEETGVTKALILDKALLPIDDVERTASTLLLAGAMQNVMSRPYDDGEAYLAPLFFNVSGLIYNKTLLEENGWSLPGTWEEFLALAEQAKTAKLSLFAYAGAEGESLLPMFASAVAGSAGTDAMDLMLRYDSDWSGDAVKGIFDDVAALSAFVADGSAGYGQDALEAAFAKGGVLFMPGDADTLARLRGEDDGGEGESSSEAESASESGSEEKEAYEYGFAAYPVLNAGDDSVSVISFTEMFIPYEAQNPGLAKKFLIFQYSDAAAKLAAEKSGEVTPVLKAVEIAGDAGITGARLDSYAALDKTVTTILFMNVTGENETLADEFTTAFSGILRGDTKAEDSISKLNGLYDEMQ